MTVSVTKQDENGQVPIDFTAGMITIGTISTVFTIYN